MADNNLEETVRLQRMFADLTDSQKQQAGEDLEEFQGMVKDVNFKKQVTAKSFRKAADKLDALWKDCKKAHAYGVSAGIVGGMLTIGGGVATIMTGGLAAPVMLAVGMGVGAGDWYSWGSPPTGLLQINWMYILTVPPHVQDKNEKKTCSTNKKIFNINHRV